MVRLHIYTRPSSLCRSCTELMEECSLSTPYSLRDLSLHGRESKRCSPLLVYDYLRKYRMCHEWATST